MRAMDSICSTQSVFYRYGEKIKRAGASIAAYGPMKKCPVVKVSMVAVRASPVPFLSSFVSKSAAMFVADGRGPLSPATKIFLGEKRAHFSNDLILGECGSFPNFFKGNAVGPGGPNKPSIGSSVRFRLFHPGKGPIMTAFHRVLLVEPLDPSGKIAQGRWQLSG